MSISNSRSSVWESLKKKKKETKKENEIRGKKVRFTSSSASAFSPREGNRKIGKCRSQYGPPPVLSGSVVAPPTPPPCPLLSPLSTPIPRLLLAFYHILRLPLLLLLLVRPLAQRLLGHQLELERIIALGLGAELAARGQAVDLLPADGADAPRGVNVERRVQAFGAEEVAYRVVVVVVS